MIELKENARAELEKFFEGREKETIRVYLTQSCHGFVLMLALDTPTADDETMDVSGFPMCIDKELSKKLGKVTIDMDVMGFVIESEIPLPASEGGCAGCSGCGGH